ncbi:hypothetical protein ACCS58_35725, partial [Rhizobium johnstonii]
GVAGQLLTGDLAVACGSGAVRLTRLKKAGGKPERVKVLASEPAEGQGVAGQLLTGDLAVACGSGAVRLTRL